MKLKEFGFWIAFSAILSIVGIKYYGENPLLTIQWVKELVSAQLLILSIIGSAFMFADKSK